VTQSPSPSSNAPLALVLGGGGARAAYQVGFLRGLARRVPSARFPIIVGASAGAINAVHLAGHAGLLRGSVDDLAALWRDITLDQVFRTDANSLIGLWLRWTARMAFGGARAAPSPRALLDTAPLRAFLAQALRAEDGRLPHLARAIDSDGLTAVAISTADLATGRTTTWVQSRTPVRWERETRRGVPSTLSLDHVLASSAVPLFFPAVRLGDSWHADGGIRQVAPLSPALKLGAGRILAISTRYRRSLAEAELRDVESYPPPAQVLGVILSAVFNDLFDHDARILARIGALADALPPRRRMGFRPARVLLQRPSSDLGALAGEREHRLPKLFRFMTRGLGTRETRNFDLLSLLLFDPAYTAEIMALGERDAEARGDQLEAFLAEG